MLPPGTIIRRALARRSNPWNWTVQLAGLALLPPALGLRSAALFGCAAVLLAASLFDLRLPPMSEAAWPVRLKQRERGWRAAPWERKKITQAATFGLLGALLAYSLLARDLGLGLLALGGVALAGVGMAQSAVELPEDDEDTDREVRGGDSFEKDDDPGDSPHPLQ